MQTSPARRIVPLTLAIVTAACDVTNPVDVPVALPAIEANTAAASVPGNYLTDTTVLVGAKVQLRVTGNSRRMSWMSTDPSVATVNNKAQVTAISVGVAGIVVSDFGSIDTVWFTVIAPPPPPPPVDTTTPPPPPPTDTTTPPPTDTTTTPPPPPPPVDTTTAPPPPPPPPPPPMLGMPSDWATGAAQAAVLPQASVDTTYPVRTGRILRVNVGQSIQKAIDTARYGDEILLQAGGTWTEQVQLPAKSGSGWIVIRSDTPLPTGGQRIRPSQTTGFAKILAPAAGYHAIKTKTNAKGWRLVGIEISAAASITSLNSLLRLGDPYETVEANQPIDIVLDRMYIHGSSTLSLTRCVELHTRDAAVLNSYITDCHTKASDSQAILGYNGPGPFLIANNYLAGAGENIMFGGATSAINGLLPCDITIVGNHIHKPASWRGIWLVKNLVEVKAGCRILAEGNILENVWQSGQTGNAVVLKSSGGSNAPWTEARDITFRSNIIKNAAFGAFALAASPEGNPAVPMKRVTIVNNLIYKMGSASDFASSGGRAITILGGVEHVLISYNTIASPELPIAIWADGEPPKGYGFTLRGNVLQRGSYGIWGSGGEGMVTVNNRYLTHSVESNVLFGGSFTASRYPASTYYAAMPSLLFANFPGWDLRLSLAGALIAGPDGKTPGVIWSVLNGATANAID